MWPAPCRFYIATYDLSVRGGCSTARCSHSRFSAQAVLYCRICRNSASRAGDCTTAGPERGHPRDGSSIQPPRAQHLIRSPHSNTGHRPWRPRRFDHSRRGSPWVSAANTGLSNLVTARSFVHCPPSIVWQSISTTVWAFVTPVADSRIAPSLLAHFSQLLACSPCARSPLRLTQISGVCGRDVLAEPSASCYHSRPRYLPRRTPMGGAPAGQHQMLLV